jgi:hypothetical protein
MDGSCCKWDEAMHTSGFNSLSAMDGCDRPLKN